MSKEISITSSRSSGATSSGNVSNGGSSAATGGTSRHSMLDGITSTADAYSAYATDIHLAATDADALKRLSTLEIIETNDLTPSSDKNVYSAARTDKEIQESEAEADKKFLNKTTGTKQEVAGAVDFKSDLAVGNFNPGKSGASIRKTGDMEVNALIVRLKTLLSELEVKGTATAKNLIVEVKAAILELEVNGAAVVGSLTSKTSVLARAIEATETVKSKDITASNNTTTMNLVVKILADLYDLDVSHVATLFRTIVKDYISSETFIPGFTGEGMKLYKALNGDWNLEVDNAVIRKAMTVFELIISKIRAVNGGLVISPANGKVKSVSETTGAPACYILGIEGDMMFVVDDLVRCQTFSSKGLKYYWVPVVQVNGDTILVKKTDFSASVVPAVGDDLVQMGNKTNKARQGMLYLTASEDGKPRISVLDGVNSTSLTGKSKVILGCLDDITDTDFPAGYQPSGYGLYADNALIKGMFILRNGKKVEDQIREDIENIQIGSRNLVLKTNQGISGWQNIISTGGTATFSEVTFLGQKGVAYNQATIAPTYNVLFYPSLNRAAFQNSLNYTFSAYVKSSVDCTIRIGLDNAGAGTLFVLFGSHTVKAGDWQKVVLSGVSNNTGSINAGAGIYISGWNNAGTISFVNIKIEEGTKATGWTPAPEDLEEIATTAQDAADKAQADATTANTKLADIANDNKLVPSEKQVTQKEWMIIQSEKAGINTSAGKYAISTTAYDAAYNALNTYITPLLSNLTITSDIIGNTFRSIFKTYYDARTNLLNAISSKTKDLADAIDKKAGDAVLAAAAAQTAANTAKSTADTAVTNAASANALLSDMANDNKLTPSEKQATKKEWDAITSEKILNDASADKFGVPKTAYGTAYAALSTYLTPLLTSLTTTRDIAGTTFRSTFKTYYDARTALLNAISAKAKELADAAQAKANEAATAAATAQTAADKVKITADAAKLRLDSWASDGSISPTEKLSLKQEQKALEGEKTAVIADASKYAVSSTAYATAYNNYNAQLTYHTTATPENIPVKSDFATVQTAYYTSLKSLRDAIATAAKKYATDQVASLRTEMTTELSAVPGKITAEIDKVSVGVRNLILKSNINETSSLYGFAGRQLSVKLQAGKTYTFVINGHVDQQALDDGKSLYCCIYESTWSKGASALLIKTLTDSTKSASFSPSEDAIFAFMAYLYPSTGNRTGKATINWAMLAEGNKVPMSWTPAPEDLLSDAALDAATKANAVESRLNTKLELIPGQITAAVTESKKYTDTAKTDLRSEIKVVSDAVTTNVGETKSIAGRVTTAEGQIKVQAGQIAQTVTKTEFNGLSTRLSSAEQKITSEAIQMTVKSQTDTIVKDAIDDIEVGGRNLVLNSDIVINNNAEYLIRTYGISEDWVKGQAYTIQIKGTLTEGQRFGVWLNGGAFGIGFLVYDSKRDVYALTMSLSTTNTTVLARTLSIYNYPVSAGKPCTVNWIKLEKGNKATGWTPAPEDVAAVTEAARLTAVAAQTAANDVKITADAAKLRLDSWASDGSISPTEKLSLKQEQKALTDEKTQIVADALKYTVASTAYATAYTNYNSELTYHTTATPENITIRAGFATYQTAYFTAKQAILNAIAAASKKYADDKAQEARQAAITDATGKYPTKTEYSAQIKILSDSITQKVSQTDFNALGNRVGTAETTISQHSGQIALKAEKTEVTALGTRMTSAEQKITPDAIRSTVKSQTDDLIASAVKRTKVTVDAMALDQNLYYPVTITLVGSTTPYTITLERPLSSLYGVPLWSTHSQGFSGICKWRSNGNGWGAVSVNRIIEIVAFYHTNSISPFGSINQLTNSSNEYIYVRGGSKYDFTIEGSLAADVNLRTVSYTASGQTIAPISSVILPVTDLGAVRDRVSLSETSITQLSNQISLKANQTDVTNLGTRLSTAEAKITPGAINLTVKSQTDTIVNAAVGGIKVGGKNLLNSDTSMLTIASLSTGNYNNIPCGLTVKLKPATKYVFSVDSSTALAGSFSEYSVYLYNSVAGSALCYLTLVPVSSNRQYVVLRTHDSIIPSDNDRLLIYAGPAGSTAGRSIRITGFQMEEGTIPTDWTQSPEFLEKNAVDNMVSLGKGKMLYRDPTFTDVTKFNGTAIYCAGNTTRSIMAVASCPNKSGKALTFVSTGWQSASDARIGGPAFGNMSRANAVFIVRLVAFIPVGRRINNYHNQYGTDGTTKWLTSQDGTGKWDEYICKVTCGSTGTFSTINHFALTGGTTPTAAAPVAWYIAYATVFDVTDIDDTPTIDEIKAEISITPGKITLFGKDLSFNGNVTFTSLDSNAQTIINGKATPANVETAKSAAITVACDNLATRLGYTNYADMEAKAIAGNTIITGGKIRTSLIDADAIVTNALLASKIAATDITTGKLNVTTGANIGGFKISGNNLRATSAGTSMNIDTNGIYFHNSTIDAGLGISSAPSMLGLPIPLWVDVDLRSEYSSTESCAARFGARSLGTFDNIAIDLAGGCISGLALKVRHVKTSVTLTDGDVWISCYNVSTITITLPITGNTGKIYYIRRMNASEVIVKGNIALVDSVTQLGIAQRGYTGVFIWDGRFWAYSHMSF